MATKRLTEEEREQIVSFYMQGTSARYIAAALDIAHTTVYRTLRSAGINARKPGAPSKQAIRRKLATMRQQDRESRLKGQYGLSLNDVAKMLDRQNRRCPICGKRLPKEYGPQMAIDHNHKTGKVRGILCPKCNQGLGFFRDNPQLLKNAIKYLTKDRELLALNPSKAKPQGVQGAIRLTTKKQYVVTLPKDLAAALKLREGNVRQWRVDTCDSNKLCLCLILREEK